MANNLKNTGNAPTKKMVMVSELRKGARFLHPKTGEITYCNYKDDGCLGVGPSNGYTTNYLRNGDSLWNTAVELR